MGSASGRSTGGRCLEASDRPAARTGPCTGRDRAPPPAGVVRERPVSRAASGPRNRSDSGASSIVALRACSNAAANSPATASPADRGAGLLGDLGVLGEQFGDRLGVALVIRFNERSDKRAKGLDILLPVLRPVVLVCAAAVSARWPWEEGGSSAGPAPRQASVSEARSIGGRFRIAESREFTTFRSWINLPWDKSKQVSHVIALFTRFSRNGQILGDP